MSSPIQITKSNGAVEPFEEEKLIGSLQRVGAPEPAIDEIVEQVEHEMRDGMSTGDIYGRAFALLRKHSHKVALKYSLRRAMMDLGPDGFPFEKFVARIFRMWGYETLTDQQVMGACISHEVDVVAWKGEALAMVEAKFHNEAALKSDVKVALYVKARFDDIAPNAFDYGSAGRKLSERWLFTNTKFTDQAVKYCECSGIRLVDWSRPATYNLHNIIERNSLQPITCLTSLSRDQKRDLIGRNVIVCLDVIGKPESLHEVGLKPEDAEKALAEAQMVIEQG